MEIRLSGIINRVVNKGAQIKKSLPQPKLTCKNDSVSFSHKYNPTYNMTDHQRSNFFNAFRAIEECDTERFVKLIKQLEPARIWKKKSKNRLNTIMGPGSGVTLIAQATKYDNADAVKALAKHGANMNQSDRDGETAAHFAAFYNKPKVLDVLAQNKTDFNKKNIEGNAPLHYAAEQVNTSNVIKKLVASGADINAKNNEGKTALHIAAKNGCLKITKLLVELGANSSIKDKNDKTALDIAKKYQEKECVEFLSNCVNTKNKLGA